MRPRIDSIVTITLLLTIPILGFYPVIQVESMITSNVGEEPVAWWEFNDENSTVVIDSSENENTGIIVGSTRSSGIVDGAMTFDGSGDYLEFNESASMKSIKTEFTIETLVMIDSYGAENGNALFMMSTSTPTDGGHENILAFWISNIPQDNKLTVVQYDTEGDYNIMTFDYVPNLEEWIMISLVGDTDGILSLYVNGKLVQDLVWDPSLRINQLDMYYIGTDIDADGSKTDFLHGIVDDFKIYNLALSGYQIEQNYYTLLDIMPEELVAEWDMNEGEGLIINDISSNNNVGDIIGGSWGEGVTSNALIFDGDQDYVVFEASSSFKTVTYSFTLEALIMLHSYGEENGNALFMMSTTTPVDPGHENILAIWASNIPNDNKTAIAISDAEGTYHEILFESGIDLYEWTLLHIVASPMGVIDYYINGTLVDSKTWNPPLKISLLNQVYLGTDIDADGNKTDFFNGKIDHIRLYNTELSSTEISTRFEESYAITTETRTFTTSTSVRDTVITNTTQAGFSFLDYLPIGITIGSVIIIVVLGGAIVCNKKSGTPSGGYYGI